MYRKIHALFLSCAIMLAMVAGVCAKPSRAALSPAAMGGQLLSVLPASDFVMYLDTQRLLTDAAPAFLATRPEILTKMNAELDKMKMETGIDPRSFDMLAVGVRHNDKSASNASMVFLARGRFDSGSVINAGLAAAAKQRNGVQRQTQEEYKGKTLYVVGPATHVVSSYVTGERSANASPAPGSSDNTGPATKATVQAGSTVAEKQDAKPRAAEKSVVTALDTNTIAMGDMESVRATIDAESGGERVDDELVQLATRNASALVGFSGKQPSAFIKTPGRKQASQDPFATSLDSIQQFYGSFSISGTDTESSLNLRTETPEQARTLKEAISAFKLLGSEPLAPKRPSGIANLLKALSVNLEGNEVQMQIKLPQADIVRFLPK